MLARYAVAQIRDGRRVGSKSNVRDVSSPYAQMRKGFQVERLDRYDKTDGQWQEILVEDKHAGPADIAASRIDFPAWLSTLKSRDRRIAMKLATGETTGNVAKVFCLSAGRVSQLRCELRKDWEQFHGDAAAVGAAVVPA